MIRLFSKRHEEAIFERKLGLSLPRKLRQRVWFTLEKFNFSYQYNPDPMSNWTETTDVLTQIEEELCRRYGVERLTALDDNDNKVPVKLKGFVRGAYPAQVLDTIELFYHDIPENLRLNFQKELNSIFEEENSEWRLVDGQFFKMDSDFLSMKVIAESFELLKAEGYEGALDEFKEAHNELMTGDYKGAIHKACNSFESVLKTLLGRESGNASLLIRELVNTDFYSDLPENLGRSFGEQVLNSLPFLRNRLGGHGQGEEVVEVPKSYAELALHLAGSFILFVIKNSISQSESVDQIEEEESDEHDLPF